MPLIWKNPCAVALLGLALAVPSVASADDPVEPDPAIDAVPVDDPTYLEALAFPGVGYRDALRLELESRFVPDAGLDDGHVSLYQPDLRARFTLPVSDRAVIRIAGIAGLAHYEFRGAEPFFGDSLDVYRTRLSVQGAYRLNHDGRTFWRPRERWSLLGAIDGGSDFEGSAFADGLGAGVALGFGYELPGTLRIAAGVSVSTSADGGGVSVAPIGFLRWNVNERVTLRNRGLGLQLEYRLKPELDLYLTGFRTTDQYALGHHPIAPMTPALDDMVLSDKMLLTGVGFEWKFAKALSVNTEAGVVAWRRLRVHSDDFGTVLSRHGDPAAYVEIRLELRP